MEENRFKKLRMELNPNDMEEYKAKDLSKDLGIAAPKISELEHGRAASLSELQAYHKFFNAPYEYLLGESNSRYYENMALSEELGLTGESLEHLKKLYKMFNRYPYNSSDRKTPEGTELRAINFLLEASYNRTLFEIGTYLDSALDDADCVQLQYVKFNYSDNGDDNSRAERINTGHCNVAHQDYDEFCETYLKNITKTLRDWWKILHDKYLKEHPRKAPDTD